MGTVWLKDSLCLESLEKEDFCLFPSLCLSTKLNHQGEAGEEKEGPSMVSDGRWSWCHGIGLGVGKGGSPVKPPVQAFLLANSFYNKGKHHYEAWPGICARGI